MGVGQAGSKPQTPRGSLWVLSGLLIILLALAGAASGSTEDSYDICRAGWECFGAGLIFGWIFTSPFVALTSIVGLVRATRDDRSGADRPLRTAVLVTGWAELAVVVVPLLWVLGQT